MKKFIFWLADLFNINIIESDPYIIINNDSIVYINNLIIDRGAHIKGDVSILGDLKIDGTLTVNGKK